MKLKLIGLLMLVLLAGCSERAQQKNFFTGGDPALATKQDVEDIKTLINQRFDRLEGAKK
jgi:hypothetical protein